MIRQAIIQGRASATVQSAFNYAVSHISNEHPGREPVEIDNGDGSLDLRPPNSTARPPAPEPQPDQPATPPTTEPPASDRPAWGRIEAGHACNVIPMHAELAGTVRCLDLGAWRDAPDLVHAAIDEVANLHGAKSEINYVRGVPPGGQRSGRDRPAARRHGGAAGRLRRGHGAGLGGEDFSWYLERVPGAMARLGVRTPVDARRDLHRGDFDADESAIKVGVELFTAAALLDGNRS